MSRKSSLTTSSHKSEARLTPEQERFRYLIRQIENVREAQAAWEKIVGKFRREHAQRLQPLRTSLRDLSRETVVTIDRLLDESTWSRVDRTALRQILCAMADALLAATPDDAGLKELFDKHSDASFDAVKREEMQRLKEEAEELTGLDLGDEADLRTEEDLIQRMYEQMAARETAEEASRFTDAQRRRESAANKRRETATQLVRQSLREIYRKLASAVHPDRESDLQRREEKNALMQRINQAYAANDLLTLLEVQIQLGQSDPDQIGKMSSQRLKQYNKLLAQQLEEAKAKLRQLEAAFREDFDLDTTSKISADNLNLVIQRQARAIRAEIARQKEFLSLLSNKAAIKRWLKDQRRFASEMDF